MAVRCNSERGRTEYLLVNLVPGAGRAGGLPDGQGLGLGDHVQPGRWVRRHPQAPGIPRARRARCAVTPLGRGIEPADLVVDRLALRRARPAAGPPGRAGVPLQDALGRLAGGPGRGGPGRVRPRRASTCSTRRPTRTTRRSCPPGVRLLPGYGRMQGLVFRPGDRRFEGRTLGRGGRPGRGAIRPA